MNNKQKQKKKEQTIPDWLKKKLRDEAEKRFKGYAIPIQLLKSGPYGLSLEKLFTQSFERGYHQGYKKGEADATAIKVPLPSHSRSSIS